MMNPKFFSSDLETTDPTLSLILDCELVNLTSDLMLGPSENLTSRAVIEAQSSLLANRCADSYCFSRREVIDAIEMLAVTRAKTLFNCNFVNVQPHSETQMNQAIVFALLNPGDTIMCLSLNCGGHYSHGTASCLSGLWFNVVYYGVDCKTGLIDMSEVLDLAVLHMPKVIFAGATSYPRLID